MVRVRVCVYLSRLRGYNITPGPDPNFAHGNNEGRICEMTVRIQGHVDGPTLT